MLFARALNAHLPPSSGILVSSAAPGFCYSELRREIDNFRIRIMERLLARTAEQGARNYVYAALAGANNAQVREQLKGGYVSECRITEESDFVLGPEGQAMQARLWVRPVCCCCSRARADLGRPHNRARRSRSWRSQCRASGRSSRITAFEKVGVFSQGASRSPGHSISRKVHLVSILRKFVYNAPLLLPSSSPYLIPGVSVALLFHLLESFFCVSSGLMGRMPSVDNAISRTLALLACTAESATNGDVFPEP